MKKIVAVIAAILVPAILCFSATAFAPQRIKSLHSTFSTQLCDAVLNGVVISASELGSLNCEPGATLDVVLAGKGGVALFLDQDGAPINTADVTVSKMRAANVTVKANIVSGAEAFDSAFLTVSGLKPVLRVQFNKNYYKANKIKIQYDFTLAINGEAASQSTVSVSGDFGKREINISSVDSVMSNTSVIVAQKNISSITLDAGMGVTLEASLSEGGRYIAIAESSSGLEPMRENSHVIDIIRLRTDGFVSGQIKSVRINNTDSLFVYDGNGAFIGMTNEKLPYLEKYCVTDKKVEFKLHSKR